MTAPTHGAVLDAESAAAWLELGERDDRTSPEEYPEMCLIEREELAEFMARAYRLARPTPDDSARADYERAKRDFNRMRDDGSLPPAQPEPDAGELAWRDVAEVPQDGSPVLLNHRTHGIIQGWFSKGEWSDDTPISPREYSGDMWILGDDLYQNDVEFGEGGIIVPSVVIGWLPADALTQAQVKIARLEELVELARIRSGHHSKMRAAAEARALRSEADAAKLRELDRLAFQLAWEDFLNANPDDLTSPDDLPDHALVTADQAFEIARQALAAQTERRA